MKYELTGKNAKNMIIVAHQVSGDYDYSEHGTLDAAAEAMLSEWWDESREESREEALLQNHSVLQWYWPSEALEAAESGYGWPISLGFVQLVAGGDQ